jgi:hypothetical protein
MLKVLTQYFAENGQLVLPNIGWVHIEKQEATWVDDVLIAPRESIVLDRSLTKPDKLFYHYLADQLDISYEQAVVQLDQYIQSFFENENAILPLGKFGSISITAVDCIWTSSYNSSVYLKEIQIKPPENRVNVEFINVPKKDNWYIWAMVLSMIALIAILYKTL